MINVRLDLNKNVKVTQSALQTAFKLRIEFADKGKDKGSANVQQWKQMTSMLKKSTGIMELITVYQYSK